MTVCSWAACRDEGTTRAAEWLFCDRHARQHEAMEAGADPDGEDIAEDLLPPRANGHGTEARARMHHRDGEPACGPCAAAEQRAKEDRRLRMTTPTATGIGLLLEQASAHGNPKVKRLGARVEALLDDLRTAIKAAEVEEEARQEVARLERQLADAKAKLRGGKVATVRKISTAREGDKRKEPMDCRKCGKTCSGPQGRFAHERHCQGEAVAS